MVQETVLGNQERMTMPQYTVMSTESSKQGSSRCENRDYFLPQRNAELKILVSLKMKNWYQTTLNQGLQFSKQYRGQ